MIILMLLLGVGSTAGNAQAPRQEIDDNEILEAVETELQFHDAVPHHLIDAQVRGGIVTLDGRSDTLLGKRYAERLVKNLKGVRAIVNQVRVLPAERSDEEIVEDVRRALRDDPVADEKELDVNVSNGHVVLEGTVDSSAEKRLADAAVAAVRGVVAVDNQVAIRAAKARPDKEITPEIVQRLARDPSLAAGLVNVDVKDGVVTLGGSVGSLSEKSRANLLSWVVGVRAVDDSQLQVEWWLGRERFRDSMVVLRNDVQIQRGVEDALLYDPRVRGMAVTVRCQERAVVLMGHVATLAAKRAAAEDARNTLGVRRVINHLKVRPKDWPGDTALSLSAEESLGRDALLADLDLRASSHFGKIYLSGVADTHFEKNRAETVVANLPGVLDVVNRITVDFQWEAKPDDQILEDAQRRLRWSPLLDAEQITVSVADGVITLQGEVATDQQRDAAAKHALQGGARRVINQLRVRLDSAESSTL